jgi:TRAP-type C4-dicarboxylate transport system permease small subunit
MKSSLRSACSMMARLVNGTVLLLVSIMLLVLSAQVIMRYVFGQALSWSEELALACFTWSMLLAIALGVRHSVHVRMDLLIDRLPNSWRIVLEKILSLVIAGSGIFLAWAGWAYVADASGTTSAAIGYPITYLYAAAPVCGGLIAIFALEQVFLGPAQPVAPRP